MLKSSQSHLWLAAAGAVLLAGSTAFVGCSRNTPAIVVAQKTDVYDEDAVFKEALARLDKNGDGKLSRDEYAPYAKDPKEFDRLDTNHDGFIDLQEFKQAFLTEKAHMRTQGFPGKVTPSKTP